MKPVLKTSALAILVALGVSACLSNKDNSAKDPVQITKPAGYHLGKESGLAEARLTTFASEDDVEKDVDTAKVFNKNLNSANKEVLAGKKIDLLDHINENQMGFQSFTVAKDKDNKNDKDVNVTVYNTPYLIGAVFDNGEKVLVKYAGVQKVKTDKVVDKIDDKEYTFDGHLLSVVTKTVDKKSVESKDTSGTFTLTVKKDANALKLTKGELNGVYGKVEIGERNFSENKLNDIELKEKFASKENIKSAKLNVELLVNQNADAKTYNYSAAGTNVVEAEKDKFIKDNITKVEEVLIGQGKEVVKAAAAK
ncbi:hypothetical protein [Haemophilus influenzae]|uniref:hypothetical protein n=1 Tax=Haemophilus influenzae TaxID=727 RepID=UPI000D01D398|nr:hypothetical protein [Haemophilus influenzae]PRL62642.1 hypothetical protein BV059_01620 [Haemophilus influenzae]PRL66159.1 hypothetical protein BV058_00529 [Haemophilus influenzae]